MEQINQQFKALETLKANQPFLYYPVLSKCIIMDVEQQDVQPTKGCSA